MKKFHKGSKLAIYKDYEFEHEKELSVLFICFILRSMGVYDRECWSSKPNWICQLVKQWDGVCEGCTTTSTCSTCLLQPIPDTLHHREQLHHRREHQDREQHRRGRKQLRWQGIFKWHLPFTTVPSELCLNMDKWDKLFIFIAVFLFKSNLRM